MDKPDISVILTAYNVESYIGHALESVLSQQDVTLEVIVVDDASTDQTWTAICKNTDPRIKRLRLGTNGGPSVARNTAIAEASGDWLAVLDGDDRFLSGRLARCLQHARKQQADIVVDNLRVYREADRTAFPMFPPRKFAAMHHLDLATFITANRLFAGGYTLGYVKPLFSVAFLRQHDLAYDPDLRIGEDYLLMAEALAYGAQCVVEPSEGYQYTVRAGSISHRLSLADITRMTQGDAKLLAHHRLPPAAMQAQQEREAYFKKAYVFTLLIDALKQKDLTGAWKAAASCPACLWLLWMPAEARLRRLLKGFINVEYDK